MAAGTVRAGQPPGPGRATARFVDVINRMSPGGRRALATALDELVTLVAAAATATGE